jgi:hypothetical protein
MAEEIRRGKEKNVTKLLIRGEKKGAHTGRRAVVR